MLIFIPSYKRYNAVQGGTLRWIPPYLRHRVRFVVREEEEEWYAKMLHHEMKEHGVQLVIGSGLTGIADTRKLIGEVAAQTGQEIFCTMDDDVQFATRKSSDVVNLRPSEVEDMDAMLAEMGLLTLTSYAQVAISLRQGNNNVGVGPSPILQENGRAIRVCSFKTKEFNECEHGRVQVMEDIDVTLQLLSKGHRNAVLYYWAQDQKATNAPGGCSAWRTHEVHDRAAHKMAELWPGICTTRLKENKTGGEFGTRTEITVQWKKAFASRA